VSWPRVTLGQVAEINPCLPKSADEKQQVSFLGMASVSVQGDITSEETRVLAKTKKGFTYFERGDVLLAKITPCFENGKAVYTNSLKNPIGYGSTEFHVLRSKNGILDAKYMFYMVWSDQFRFLGGKAMKGAAGQKRISADFLKEFNIPLPPLTEQKRIAAILDKADSLRRKNQQAIQLADKFLRAVFLDMFAKQTGVKSCSVGELCEVKGGKRLPAGHDYVGDKSDHPYLRVVDFLNGSIDQTNLKYISHETHKKIQRYTITSDDVFISIAGSIGITGTIPSTLDGANLTENAAKLVIRNSSAILNEYLAYWLNTPEAQTQIANKTMSTSQPKLALFRIEELLCPLPPIADQMKFVSIKRKVFDGIVKMQNTESASSNLFNSLSQKAFAGEL
jgi:type I restriction enzyme S subunit